MGRSGRLARGSFCRDLRPLLTVNALDDVASSQ